MMQTDVPTTAAAAPAAAADADRDRLTPAARRALAEAAARRRAQELRGTNVPVEIEGRGGMEPVRYGDWEVRGLASDF